MKTPVQLTLFLIVYLNLSAIEYVSHRWIMHSHEDSSLGLFWKIFGKEATDHQLHHTTVQSDMTLDVSSLEDEKSGLFFHYEGTFIYFIAFYVLFTVQFKLFKIKMRRKPKIVLILLIVFFYSMLSNSLHLEMHDEQGIILPSTHGVSNRYQSIVVKLIPRFWLDYIVENHNNHHRYKSTTNFNFILPFFDHVMGTCAPSE